MSPIEAAAHSRAMREAVRPMAQALQEALGQRLVAYATGTRSPQAVGRWAAGHNKPYGQVQRRLRALYRVYLTLSETEDDATIRAWLVGANPQLGERAPIELLREDDETAVFRAATAFVEG
jgi:hypothetical protein